MDRLIKPELLDELPAQDPRAIRSRQDLQRINRFMGNHGIVARALEELFPDKTPSKLVEIGGGDGTFMLEVARSLSWRDVDFILIDLQSIVSDFTRAEFQRLGWRLRTQQSDVFTVLHQMEKVDGIVANLVLHHFQENQLRCLFHHVAERTDAFLACEPRRNRPALLGSHLVGLLGCNAVTRHDAVVSVRAGFVEPELTELWPRSIGWNLREKAASFASHVFHARRNLPDNMTS